MCRCTADSLAPFLRTGRLVFHVKHPDGTWWSGETGGPSQPPSGSSPTPPRASFHRPTGRQVRHAPREAPAAPRLARVARRRRPCPTQHHFQRLTCGFEIQARPQFGTGNSRLRPRKSVPGPHPRGPIVIAWSALLVNQPTSCRPSALAGRTGGASSWTSAPLKRTCGPRSAHNTARLFHVKQPAGGAITRSTNPRFKCHPLRGAATA